MARGNQREIDRKRSQKRAEKNSAKEGHKNTKQAMSNVKEHDAEIMRQKQAAAQAKKEIQPVQTQNTKGVEEAKIEISQKQKK